MRTNFSSRRFLTALPVLAILAVPSVSSAQGVAGVRCDAPAGTFGPNGIPTNDAMCKLGGNTSANMYLSITRTYNAAAVTADGLGNYMAQKGDRNGAPIGLNVGYAQWNASFAVDNAVGGFFRLSQDVNAASNVSSMTFFDFTGGTDGKYWDSTNMGYYSTHGTLSPNTFDNNVDGTYNFRLQQYSDAARTMLMDEVAVNAVVGQGGTTVTPEPASVALLGLALLPIGAVARRRNRKKLVA